jgi:hypothetical protein
MLLNANAFWIWIIVAVLAADVIHTITNRRVLMNVKKKSDTTWEYIYRRATIRALKRGFVTMNSPLMVKPELAKAYEPIKPELVGICQKAKARHATDPDVALEIEKQCFPWIAEYLRRLSLTRPPGNFTGRSGFNNPPPLNGDHVHHQHHVQCCLLRRSSDPAVRHSVSGDHQVVLDALYPRRRAGHR